MRHITCIFVSWCIFFISSPSCFSFFPQKRNFGRFFFKDLCLSIILRLFSHLDTRLDSWLQKFGQAHRYASSGSDARKDRGNGFPVPMVFFPKVGRSVPQINGGGWCVFFWPNFHHIILKIGSNWCGICAVSVLYMVV